MKGSKKGKGYRIRGSLASRILLISLLFLVFPLLALVGLLYIEDAKIKSDNNYFILKVMMDQKEDFVTEMVDHEQVFMSGISYLLREIPEAEKTLPELAKREEVSAFIHVEENKEGRFFSSMASDPSFLNKEYTDVIDQARVGTVFYLDPDSSLFYLTHIERERTRAWIIAFTLTSILNNFPIENDVITPSSTSLVAQSGKIISSTDDAFEGKQLKIPIGNSITIDETDYVTDFRKIANANFGLMIAAPEEANFVNIPHFVIKVIVGLSIIAVLGGGGAFFLTKKLGHPL
ncbi:MAG: hypothetical protein KDK63_01680, partial [Chlamydiia bacterium]|nr:hypothetical protein [Chlamydiia bacterium]